MDTIRWQNIWKNLQNSNQGFWVSRVQKMIMDLKLLSHIGTLRNPFGRGRLIWNTWPLKSRVENSGMNIMRSESPKSSVHITCSTPRFNVRSSKTYENRSARLTRRFCRTYFHAQTDWRGNRGSASAGTFK